MFSALSTSPLSSARSAFATAILLIKPTWLDTYSNGKIFENLLERINLLKNSPHFLWRSLKFRQCFLHCTCSFLILSADTISIGKLKKQRHLKSTTWPIIAFMVNILYMFPLFNSIGTYPIGASKWYSTGISSARWFCSFWSALLTSLLNSYNK